MQVLVVVFYGLLDPYVGVVQSLVQVGDDIISPVTECLHSLVAFLFAPGQFTLQKILVRFHFLLEVKHHVHYCGINVPVELFIGFLNLAQKGFLKVFLTAADKLVYL